VVNSKTADHKQAHFCTTTSVVVEFEMELA